MKKVLVFLGLLGMAAALVSCSTATSGGGGGTTTYSISGTISNIYPTSYTYQSIITVTGADVSVQAYTSSSYSGTAASSTTVAAPTTGVPGSGSYQVSSLPDGTYYIKASQVLTVTYAGYPAQSITITGTSGAVAVSGGSVTGKNISLSTPSI